MDDAQFYKMHAFSVKHPELRANERWVCNVDNYTIIESVASKQNLKPGSYRCGAVAYDRRGLPIAHYRPLFARTDELDY